MACFAGPEIQTFISAVLGVPPSLLGGSLFHLSSWHFAHNKMDDSFITEWHHLSNFELLIIKISVVLWRIVGELPFIYIYLYICIFFFLSVTLFSATRAGRERRGREREMKPGCGARVCCILPIQTCFHHSSRQQKEKGAFWLTAIKKNYHSDEVPQPSTELW